MKKRYISGILVLVMLVASLSGCKSISPFEAYQNYKEGQEKIYVAFSNDDQEVDPMDYREIADYQSVYSRYNSRVMYDTLPPAEQQIYRLMEYAMDKEYTTIFFDSRLLTDVKLPLDDILLLLSSDTPMVQQNYSYSSYETGYTFSYFGELFTFEITGEAFYVENFSHEAMEKKKEAVAAAEKVFATMPQDLSQLEQARFFFRYLTRQVKYTENKAESGEQHNLYDAFVQKKTQCDGFANAFSLLCAMAEIPCVEKVTSPAKEDEVGHTWNVFCADGVWYNADMSLSKEYASQHKRLDVDFNFGFSDGRADEQPDMAERFPKCTEDLLPIDLMVRSASDPKLLRGLRDAFKEKGKRFVLVGLEKGELSDDDLQRIANYLYAGVTCLDEEIDGKNCYYIFKK